MFSSIIAKLFFERLVCPGQSRRKSKRGERNDGGHNEGHPGSAPTPGDKNQCRPGLRVALSKVALTGVSSLAYIFIAIEKLGWIVYVLLTGHLTYLVVPLVQAPVALIIAIKARNQKKGGGLYSRLIREGR